MDPKLLQRLRETEGPMLPAYPASPLRCFRLEEREMLTTEALLRGLQVARARGIDREPVELRVSTDDLASIEHDLEDVGEQDGKRLVRIRGDATVWILEGDAS